MKNEVRDIYLSTLDNLYNQIETASSADLDELSDILCNALKSIQSLYDSKKTRKLCFGNLGNGTVIWVSGTEQRIGHISECKNVLDVCKGSNLTDSELSEIGKYLNTPYVTKPQLEKLRLELTNLRQDSGFQYMSDESVIEYAKKYELI